MPPGDSRGLAPGRRRIQRMRRMQRRDFPATAIRDAVAADFGDILRLNAASEHFLSPVTRERLELLHRQAAYHRVIEAPDGLAAFLLAPKVKLPVAA